jgi:hypothetical protein
MLVIPATWKAEPVRAQVKRLARSHFKNKLNVVVHACNPSYSGDGGGKIVVGGELQKS